MPSDLKPTRNSCASCLMVLMVSMAAVAIASMLLRPAERTEKKATQSLTKTEVAAKATSASSKSRKIDTTGFTFDSGSKAAAAASARQRKRRLTTRKITTNFNPQTGSPIERVEEETTLSDLVGAQNQVTSVVQEQHAVASSTSSITANTTQTEKSSSAMKSAIERTLTETSVRPAQPQQKKAGLAYTPSGKLGITYDFARKSIFTVSGLVTFDPKEKELSAVGAGVNTDVWFKGRYYVGIYGIHDIHRNTNGVTGLVGVRF